MNVLMFVGGLILLVIGANVLVRGASKLALSFGISPLVIGLTIVAFGTSAPEVAVSVGAALDGRNDMAVGNVQLIRQEVPIMIGASLLLVALAMDGRLDRLESALLLALLGAYTAFLI